MEARGYGLRGRTSFNLYRFTARDMACIAVMLIFAAGAFYGIFKGKNMPLFYPEYVPPAFDAVTVFSMICFMAMLAVPFVMDVYGEIRWNKAGQAGAAEEIVE